MDSPVSTKAAPVVLLAAHEAKRLRTECLHKRASDAKRQRDDDALHKEELAPVKYARSVQQRDVFRQRLMDEAAACIDEYSRGVIVRPCFGLTFKKPLRGNEGTGDLVHHPWHHSSWMMWEDDYKWYSAWLKGAGWRMRGNDLVSVAPRTDTSPAECVVEMGTAFCDLMSIE